MSDHPSGVSPSSRLIEDAHQGVTSKHAQATIDRYREFVKARNAPIANMQYSPFTKQTTRAQQMHHGEAAVKPAEVALPTKSLVEEVVLRQWSPRRVSASNQLEPSVLHNKIGGTAWSLDLPGWVKTSGGSKRGSLTGLSSAAGSRKSSLTFSSEKQMNSHLLSQQPQRFETSQSIWNATTHTGGESHRGSFTRRSFEKQEASSERLAEPKRNSLTLGATGKSFLRAHSTEEKFGVTMNSRPMRTGINTLLLNAQGKKFKRASMPPLQNRRGLLEGNVSRRSSLSMAQPNRAMHNQQVLRNRSQSLPTDSLFLAYSSCALPTVMTSSLAAMPIPSQPAIPVSVARRYSILTSEVMPVASPGTLETEKNEEAVHVDPMNIEGIDTSSVLDTSHLQDIATEEDDMEEMPVSRGGPSTYATPAGSPMAADDGAMPISSDAFPVVMATVQESPTANTDSTSSSTAFNFQQNGASARSRSLIHTKQKNGLTISAPARDQLATPDYTPMTSPTNLSNPIFKQTLIGRRMSEVVSRDVAQKLRLLKQHMEQRQDSSSDDDGEREVQ